MLNFTLLRRKHHCRKCGQIYCECAAPPHPASVPFVPASFVTAFRLRGGVFWLVSDCTDKRLELLPTDAIEPRGIFRVCRNCFYGGSKEDQVPPLLPAHLLPQC